MPLFVPFRKDSRTKMKCPNEAAAQNTVKLDDVTLNSDQTLKTFGACESFQSFISCKNWLFSMTLYCVTGAYDGIFFKLKFYYPKPIMKLRRREHRIWHEA
uniref:Uncharacterized protein n=1 Tax=Onchocerca volvulus TaxID=6282 RepID=A0A8R1TJN1_ONCVO